MILRSLDGVTKGLQIDLDENLVVHDAQSNGVGLLGKGSQLEGGRVGVDLRFVHVENHVRGAQRAREVQEVLRVRVAQAAQHVAHFDAETVVAVVDVALHRRGQAPLHQGHAGWIHRVGFDALEVLRSHDREVSFAEDVADVLHEGFEGDALRQASVPGEEVAAASSLGGAALLLGGACGALVPREEKEIVTTSLLVSVGHGGCARRSDSATRTGAAR